MPHPTFVKQKYFRLTTVLVAGFFLFGMSADAQQAVQIQVTVQQPVTPYLPQLAADIQGQQFGSLSQKLSIRITNVSNQEKRVKLSGKIERVAPEHMSVTLRPDYQPSRPILLRPQQTIILDDQDLVEQAFGNFSRRQLMFDNLDLSALRQNEVNYKLPEGTYRICVDAFDFDRPGQSVPLSAQGANCAVFRICYTASAPQFTMPVSTLMGGRRDMTVFSPTSSQIQFAWTPPATTCGLPLRSLTYDLEIREMFPGQSISDAKFNPFVFRQQNIRTTGFILDTLKYPNVFRSGKKYVVRVKANIMRDPTSPVEIANQGYSEIAYLEYQPKTKPGLPPVVATLPKQPQNKPLIPGAELPPTTTTMSTVLNNKCEGVPKVSEAPVSSDPITGKDLKIGAFTLHIDAATLSGNAFSGNGYVIWKPYGKQILLKAGFKDIRVNTDGQVIAGEVNTISDDVIPKWASLQAPENIPYLSNAVNGTLSSLVEDINRVASPIRQILGDAPVNFPLGLNNQNIAGVKSTLAIMGISFTPEGTNMRVLFSMNIPDADGWLSLAGTNFCINPDGFSFGQGLLYLPEDKKLNFGGGYDLTFRKSDVNPITHAVDTSGKTYLLWSAQNGFERVVVAGDMKFSQQTIVAVNSSGNRTGEPMVLEAKFDFTDWNDWVASIKPKTDFEFKNLPGFAISATEGLYYDHSDKRNPAGLALSDFPKVYQDKGWSTGADFEGVYMKSLKMKLPKDFLGTSGTNTSIGFNNLFIDKHGVSAVIAGTNILTAGKLGGWAFSINAISIAIEANIPGKDMKMTGKIGLPISNDQLNYTCLLNTSSDGLDYQFSINPPSNGMNIPLWAATFKLDPSSTFSIVKDQYGAAIKTQLSGKLDISIKDPVAINFTAMSIRNMKMGNRQDGKEGFNFESGDIDFGSGSPGSTVMLRPYSDISNQIAQYTGGPFADEETSYLVTGESESDKNVGGFAVTVDHFKPVVGLETKGFKVGLSFDLGVDLAFGSAIGLAGKTELEISGHIDPKDFKPIIKPDEMVTINKVSIKGEFGNFLTVDASLKFMKGSEWGQGVDGSGTVTFMPGIKVDARVIFGKKDNFNYYGFGAAVANYASGLAAIGPLIINGFGGGYFHNLTMVTISKEKVSGLSGSGIQQVQFSPNKGSETFMANIALAYVNSTVLKADVTLSATITNSALALLKLDGQADVFSDGQPNSEGTVHVDMNFQYDFVHDAFDGFLSTKAQFISVGVYVPIWIHSGYNGVVADNETPEERNMRKKDKTKFSFFLYVGYPTPGSSSLIGETYDRIRLTLVDIKNAVVKAKLGADAYLCLGTILPPFPDLPPKISNFLNGGSSAKNSSNSVINNLINSGGAPSGFMFGASVTGDVDLNLLILRAYASATIGFDVGLVHVSSSNCVPAGQTMGFHNWYAVGQIYAYLKLGVDLHIDVGLFNGDVTLAKLQVGAALRGGLPNPVWMNGRVKVVGEALGGLVHVNKTFTMEINQPCYPETNPLDKIQLIAEVGPSTDDLNIFEKPYVVFNLPMKKSDFTFTVMDKNGNEKIRTYRFFVKDYKITRTGGLADQGKAIYSADGYTMTLWSDSTFAPNKKYTVEITCQAEEYVNNQWGDPVGSNGKKSQVTQTEKVNFQTGKAPAIIDERHIVISYPLNGQRFFLKNEFKGKKGIIVLDQYTSGYFSLEGESNPLQKVIFLPQDGGQKIEQYFNVVNNSGKSRIEFDIPGSLKNGATYLLYLSIESRTKGGEQTKKTQTINLQKVGSITNGFKNESEMGVALKIVNDAVDKKLIDPSKIEAGVHAQGNEVKVYQPQTGRIIYKMVFQTSKFNTFSEKMASYGNNLEGSPFIESSGKAMNGLTGISGNNWSTHKLNVTQGSEGFDEFEILGKSRTVGTGNSSFTYKMPPLLNVQMMFDKSKENDKYMDDLYSTSFYLGMAFSFVGIDFGNPNVRGDNRRPDYTVSLSKTNYVHPVNLNSVLNNSNSTSTNVGMNVVLLLEPTVPVNKLSIVYERDKYFAYDEALVKSAYYNFLAKRSYFNPRYETLVREKNEYEKLYKKFLAAKPLSPEWNKLLLETKDAVTEYLASQKLVNNFINSNATLAKGLYGKVTINDSYLEKFWVENKLLNMKDKITGQYYKPLPQNTDHNLKFIYGFDPTINSRWNSAPINLGSSGTQVGYSSSLIGGHFTPMFNRIAQVQKKFRLLTLQDVLNEKGKVEGLINQQTFPVFPVF